MKKEYSKPISKVYNISPKRCAIGLPITSEYDDDSRQSRKYNQESLENNNTSHNNLWEEW